MKGSTLWQGLEVLMRGRRVFLLCFGSVLALTLAYLLLSPRVFEATSSIIVEDASNVAKSVVGLEVPAASGNVGVEVEVLRSKDLATRVADELLRRAGIATNHEVSIERFPLLSESVNEQNKRRAIARVLHKNVEVQQLRRDIGIIHISYRSTNKDESAYIANLYAGEYEKRNIEVSRQKAAGVRSFVEKQLLERGERLLAAEDALQLFEEAEDAIALDDEALRLARLTADLQTSRDQALVELRMVDAQLASIQSEIGKIEPNLADRVSSAVIEQEISALQETIAKIEVKIETKYAQNPELRGNEDADRDLPGWIRQVSSLQIEADKKARQYIEQMMAAGGVNPDISSDRSSLPSALAYITQLKRQLVDKNIERASIRARVSALTTRLAEYEGDFEAIPGQARQVARLQRELSSSEDTYEWLMTKYNEAKILEESEFGFVRVLDTATQPLDPVSPNWVYSFVLALVGGLMLGAFAAALHEILDDRMRTPADFRVLGLQLSAVIPKFAKSPSKLVGQELSKALVRLDTDGEAKSILVTAPGTGEGKSFAAKHLAISSARTGARTLLISCSSNEHDRQQLGLIDLLQRRTVLNRVVRKTGTQNLYRISFGKVGDNESVVVDGKTMSLLVSKLSASFDRIVLDGSGLNESASTLALTKFADRLVVVVQSGVTRMGDLREAMQSIEHLDRSKVHMILNAFDAKESYGFYSRRDYYGSYGKQSAASKLRKKRIRYVYSKPKRKKPSVEQRRPVADRRQPAPQRAPKKHILKDSIYAPKSMPQPLRDWLEKEYAKREQEAQSGDGIKTDKVDISI